MVRTKRRLVVWGLSAATAGFLFGYQAGVISGALLFVRREFALSDVEQGALVSMLPLGALVGGLIAGDLADRIGRRGTLIADGLVFVAGTILAVVAPSYVVLLVARAITGAGVGIAAVTVPLYLSELAPPAARGRLVTLNQLMITLGILAAYCVDLVFAGSGSWRAMFALALVPAAVLVGRMLRAPETPAWLEAHGDPDAARRVIAAVTDRATADLLLDDLRRSRAQDVERIAARDLLRSSAAPALMIGVTLAAAQQFAGINAIISYAPTIMEKTGLNLSDSVLYSVLIAVVNVAATIVSFRLVDRLGRRPLLLLSAAGMFASLVVLGLIFLLPAGAAQSWLALACLLVYIASFAVGLGPVFWVLIAEIFPPAARAAGASVSTATSWLSNVVVGLGFLAVTGALGEAPTFWIFAAVCAFVFAFAYRYVPETKGRRFSEIDQEVRARRTGRARVDAPSARPTG